MGIRYWIFLGLVVSIALLWCLTLIIVASARGRKISKCPHCHSRRIRSSWPGCRDKFLLLIGITAYRCEACLKRFYAMRRNHENSVLPKRAAKLLGGLSREPCC
jgi:DNA-directed RNA polymerase subunit RPC12/RpoP